MSLAAKKNDTDADSKDNRLRRRRVRHDRFRRQSANAIVVMERSSYDPAPKAILSNYADVVEYGRLVLSTEDVVLLDQWGHVIENAETRQWFSNPPHGMAEGKYVVETEKGSRYVPSKDIEYRLHTVRAATFQELDMPVCGPCKRKGDGKYITGSKENPERFLIRRQGESTTTHTFWECFDTEKEQSYSYNSRKKDAIQRANRVLRVEFSAKEVARGFTDPEYQ